MISQIRKELKELRIPLNCEWSVWWVDEEPHIGTDHEPFSFGKAHFPVRRKNLFLTVFSLRLR